MRLGLLLCALALLGAQAGALASDLEQVMGLLARRQHGHVSFVEQQFLAVLDRPLESWGELLYEAPDRLEKRTVQPRAETLVLAGDQVTVQRGARRHVLDLQKFPQILPYAASIRAVMAGDLPTLMRLFTVELDGTVEQWSLVLVPRDKELAGRIAVIRVDGARDSVLRVETRQVDGDRTLMTIRPLTPP
jgi:outer membrane lipoprotein-sorting protein